MVLPSNPVLNFLKKHVMAMAVTVISFGLIILLLISTCYLLINPYKKYIVTTQNAQHIKVGLVLGAGINNNGQPYKELQARLDKAADALNEGIVSKLILSGDNRFENYDEPTAMYKYLIEKRHIPSNQLQRDYAGRSTYESCGRAAKIFELKKTIIFSAESHLPRAIYLCRHFGIETYGVSSGVEANNSTRRELLARVKAVYNVELIGEHTVLGSPIPM